MANDNANIYVTATLNNFAMIVQQASDLDTFLKSPELHYIAPWTLENFEPANNRYKARFGPPQYAVLRDLLAIQRKLLWALDDGGVPLMAGTDVRQEPALLADVRVLGQRRSTRDTVSG